MNCGCTDDSFCKKGKRLWKLKSGKSRKAYSYHRMAALGLLDQLGRPDKGIESIWTNNTKSE